MNKDDECCQVENPIQPCYPYMCFFCRWLSVFFLFLVHIDYVKHNIEILRIKLCLINHRIMNIFCWIRIRVLLTWARYLPRIFVCHWASNFLPKFCCALLFGGNILGVGNTISLHVIFRYGLSYIGLGLGLKVSHKLAFLDQEFLLNWGRFVLIPRLCILNRKHLFLRCWLRRVGNRLLVRATIYQALLHLWDISCSCPRDEALALILVFQELRELYKSSVQEFICCIWEVPLDPLDP